MLFNGSQPWPRKTFALVANQPRFLVDDPTQEGYPHKSVILPFNSCVMRGGFLAFPAPQFCRVGVDVFSEGN